MSCKIVRFRRCRHGGQDVQGLHAALKPVIEPKIELMEVRLKVVAADVMVDSTNPVLQVENVPMQRFEIRLLITFLHIVPSSREKGQISLPAISGHDGCMINRILQGSLERLPRGIVNDLRVASLQLSYLSRRIAVINLDRNQNKALAPLASARLSFLATANKNLIYLHVINKLNAILNRLHRLLHLALKKPSYLLVDTKLAGQLTRTHALFRRGQQMHHRNGRGQWEFDLVKQGIRCRRLIKPTRSTSAMVARASFDRMGTPQRRQQKPSSHF